MGPNSEERSVQDNENKIATKYVLRNYVKDPKEYEKKKNELDFLFENYNLKPMGDPFKESQTYWIFNKNGYWQQGKCTGNDNEVSKSNFTFGVRSFGMVNWEQPGWYRSGSSAFFNRKKSFNEYNYIPDNPNNPAGGKRRKLIRKKSQRRSRQRTQRRSSQRQRQRTQRRR